MGYSHCMGTEPAQVQGTGQGAMEIFTQSERRTDQDTLIVQVQFPVPVSVSFPCSVNKP